MLLIATFILIALAMAGLGLSLFFGRAEGPQAGCGRECRCRPDEEET